ncbi:MAG: hypothetical protein MUF42_07790 [Cytophagaceae bacterium]|jgi:hypothetical protein|nr:hypothetical protein [Cytophagaceae bacterium]
MHKKGSISKARLQEYLRTQDASLKHQFEKDALADPFVYEALEGLDEMENASVHISDLNNRLKSKKKQNRLILVGGAAAIVLLLSLSSFWVWQMLSINNSPEMAQKNTSGQNDDPQVGLMDTLPPMAVIPNQVKPLHQHNSDGFQPKQMEEIHAPSVSALEENIGSKLEELPELSRTILPLSPTSPITKNDIESINDSIMPDFQMYEYEKNTASPKPAIVPQFGRKEAKRAKEKNKKSNGSDLELTIPSVASKSEVKEQKDAALKDSVLLASLLEDAIQLHNNKSYDASRRKLEEYLESFPSNGKALYYSGLNEKFLGNKQRSLLYLEKVKKGDDFYFKAKWEIYIQYKDQPEISKTILSELAAEPNEYQKEAQKILGF